MQDDQPVLHRLGGALALSFRRLAQAVECGEADNPGLWWADFVAAALNNILLRDPTAFEDGQTLLPFARPHEIRTSAFAVPGSGSMGRGSVDVLFQLWLDTETTHCALGTPLLFRAVNGSTPVPPTVWSEILEAARPLGEWAPSSRIVLCGHPDPFGYPPGRLLRHERVYAMPAAICAGFLTPPRGMSGVRAESLGHDLASGWLGDPVLGGANESLMQSFLRDFEIQCVLRLHVAKPT